MDRNGRGVAGVLHNFCDRMSRLHVDSVVKSYNGRAILTDIFISCESGEIVGLLGRNGCGKSTLLKIIFGSLKADHRFVKVDELYISGLGDGHRHIKYLPQDGFLPNNMKVRTAVDLFCAAPDARHVVEHHLVKPFLGKKTRELSGGERRFFEVLLMIYSDAPFVLLDEPFSGISPIYIEEMKTLLKDRAADKGFILTDHNYRNILDVSSRVILLHDGAVRNVSGLDDLRYWNYIR